jgi:hypothetical protein
MLDILLLWLTMLSLAGDGEQLGQPKPHCMHVPGCFE